MAGFSYGSAPQRIGRTSGGIIANAMQPRVPKVKVAKVRKVQAARRR